MQRVLSTYPFTKQPLSNSLLGSIARAGIHAIEIFCAQGHFAYGSAAAVDELASWLEACEIAVHALHSPTDRSFAPGREGSAPISIAEPERLRRLDAVDEVKRALDVAERIRFGYLVQHLGRAREPFEPHRVEAAFHSLEHLALFAKQRGVTIALENIPGELATAARLRRFLEETRLRDVRLCFDIGHAHLQDGVGPSFLAMGGLAVTTHLHDNHGELDEHLPPYEGTIDWAAALALFARASHELPFVLELKEPTPGAPETLLLDQALTAFARLESNLPGEASRGGTQG
jgi:sugar phosphate isomerase/epimerase